MARNILLVLFFIVLYQLTRPEPAPNINYGKTVYVYTTSWCPACKAAREFLDKNGIFYIEHDIEKQPRIAAEHQQLLGDKKRPDKVGVPLFVIDDEIMLGLNKQWVLSNLSR